MMAGMNHNMNAAKKTFPKLPPNSIGIDNFAFEPKALTVAAGTTVTWVNPR